MFAPSNDENPSVTDRARAEEGGEGVRLSHVVQFAEPVDDLTKTVVESRRPFARCFPSLLDEQTVRPRILELNEAVAVCDGIADNQIAGEIAKQGKLEGETVKADDVPAVRANEG